MFIVRVSDAHAPTMQHHNVRLNHKKKPLRAVCIIQVDKILDAIGRRKQPPLNDLLNVRYTDGTYLISHSVNNIPVIIITFCPNRVKKIMPPEEQLVHVHRLLLQLTMFRCL